MSSSSLLLPPLPSSSFSSSSFFLDFQERVFLGSLDYPETCFVNYGSLDFRESTYLWSQHAGD